MLLEMIFLMTVNRSSKISTLPDVTLHPQPSIYLFEPDVYGKDFTDPNVRTPWFQDVVKHLVAAEKNDFAWPTGEPAFKSDKASYTLPNNKPDLTALLYQDLERIKSWG